MSTITEARPTGGTATLVEEETDLQHEQGDHERFSHYVRKESLTDAMVFGTPVEALCGKLWVPSRDPSRFPLCPMCQEIYEGPGWADDPVDANSGPAEK